MMIEQLLFVTCWTLCMYLTKNNSWTVIYLQEKNAETCEKHVTDDLSCQWCFSTLHLQKEEKSYTTLKDCL